jgi:biopolymer transport protein ExbD
MAASGDDLDNENTSINITPLVDIMLVLLIIFLVTANTQQKRTIDVQLPKASTGQEVIIKGEPLAFTIDKDSQIFLNGRKMKIEEIEEKVEFMISKGIKFQTSLAADSATPHGTVMRLIDTLRKHNIIDFALDVENK